MTTMPVQKPGRSEQSVGTDPLFVAAVVKRFGPLAFDLAASPENSLAPRFYSAEQNSLKQDWGIAGNLWLNPPFKNIAPWAARCRFESRRVTCFPLYAGPQTILFLVPASIGSNWFLDSVHNEALVLALNPRLTFVGHKQCYPKDMMLCVYGADVKPGFDVWRWRK